MQSTLPLVKMVLKYLLIGILLLAVIIYFSRGCNQPAPDGISPLSDSVTYWKNKYGDEVASKIGYKEQFAIVNKQWLDSIAYIYKTKASNIQEVVVSTVEGKTSLAPVPDSETKDAKDYFEPVIIGTDTCPPVPKNIRKTFSNPYYTAEVQVGQDPYLNLTSHDTITTLWKTVKTGNIFHRQQLLQLDISFADTSRHVTGAKAFRRLDNPKEISLNAESQILYYNNKLITVAGFGVERSSSRFNVGVTVGRDLQDLKQWYGSAHFNFKLIKL